MPVRVRTLALFLGAALGLSGCAGASRSGLPGSPPVPPGTRADTPGAVLARFVDALEAGRWQEADALLSARWRASYGPARLAADWAGAGPLAREAAAGATRALAAGTPWAVEGDRATLPVAAGQALLVAEGGRWRVDALE